MVLRACWCARKPGISKFTRGQCTLSSNSSTSSLASILRSSAHDKTLPEGLRTHTHITFLGLEHHKLLSNLLVHMYGSFGHLQEACFLFTSLPTRDSFSWSFIITAYTRLGCFDKALELFVNMQIEGCKPDKFIFASILSVCAEKAAFTTGMHIHFLITSAGLELDVILENSITNLYAKSGCLDDAQVMFFEIHQRSEASYNAMISGYASLGQGHNAIVFFNKMMMEGIMPNKGTFVAMVSACVNNLQLEGEHMHARLAAREYKLNVILGNTLINMYGKCGDSKKSMEVFDGLPQRSIVSWNALITSYAHHGQGDKAFELFDRLHQEGELPNSVTFRGLLPGFESLALKECKKLHIRVICHGVDGDHDVTSNLINMYCKCGSYIDAQEVFNLMSEHDLIAWNALIAGFSQHVADKPILWQFHQMLQESVLPDKVTFLSILSKCAYDAALAEGRCMHALLASSKIQIDVVVGSALLNMYGKCGSINEAVTVFFELPEQNEYSWAAMVGAYALHGDASSSMLMFERMQWEGIKPDRVSILCLLCACTNHATLIFCKHVHTFLLESGLETDPAVRNSLLTMYSKCGSLDTASTVFKKMLRKNLVSWTAAIAACAQHGQGKEAFSCFEQMQEEGVYPDKVTFVEMLSACSRAGLVDEACYVLASMKQQHGVKPTGDHHNCVIDLLSRAGRLDIAEHLIMNMPTRPTAVSWLTLLGACRSQLDLERGEHAARWACNLSLKDAAPYVTLSNLYAESGRFDDAAFTMHQMWLCEQEQQHCYS